MPLSATDLSLTQLACVLETTGAGIWEWDIELGTCNLNPCCLETLGYSSADFTQGEAFWALIHPEDAVRSKNELEACWRGETSLYRCELRMLHKDGRYLGRLVVGEVVERLTNGRVKRMVGSCSGISIGNEPQLRNGESHTSLESFFELSLEFLCIANTEGYFEKVNHTFIERLGYSEAELLSKPYIEFVHPDDRNATESETQNLADGITISLFDNRYVAKNGDVIFLRWSSALEPKSNKVFASARDVTERSQIELRLDRQQQMFESMSEQGRIGAWELDLIEGKIFWSSMTKKIHEVTADYEPSLDTAINYYKEGYSRDTISTIVEQGIATGKPWNVELQIVTVNGHELWVAATGKAEFESGKAVRLFGSFQDIDQRKKTEQALTKAKEQAELAANAKNEFLAIMSHEIRTPLNGVMGMLSLLKNSSLDASQERKVHIARSSAESLLGVINDILDFTKIDAGKLDLANRPFDVRSGVEDICESLALRAQEKGLVFILDLSRLTKTAVVGDFGRFRQVLVNLIGNAIKFTHEGEVQTIVHLANKGGHLELGVSVRDTGIGMASSLSEDIFEPFTQIDGSSTRKYGGTGLGLAICKRLVNLMGGDIGVESIEGKGTTFYFTVQLEYADTRQNPDFVVDLTGISVLVIEQNETLRNTVKHQLTLWGAAVEATDSQTKVFDLLDVRQTNGLAAWDLVLVDGQDVTSVVNFPAQMKTKMTSTSPCLVLVNAIDKQCSADDLVACGYSSQILKPIVSKDYKQVMGLLNVRSKANEVVKSQPIIQPLMQRKVLLVEDNQVNQDVARMMLEEMNIAVDLAEDGKQALAFLNNQTPATEYIAVLMDCQMPIMDGYAATIAIRNGDAGEQNRTIPIIAMTAYAMKGDKQKCLDSGMDDYLTKPFTDEDLEKKLKPWISQAQSN